MIPYVLPEVMAVGGAPLPVFESPRPAWFPPQLDWVFGCYYDGLPGELAEVLRLIGVSMSVRKEALNAIGGFQSDNHDDMDMCHRLAHLRPHQLILLEPRVVVFHHVPLERVSWSYLWRRCFFVNKSKYVALKNMGPAASMEADFRFVMSALRRGALQCSRDLSHGDLYGIARLAVLLTSIFLAAAGNFAGRIKALQIRRSSTTTS